MNNSRLFTFQKILLVLFVAVFVAFLYTVLHEGGHALVTVLAGGRVTAFNVNFLSLDAHVEAAGSLTRAQGVINNLAGMGLPLLVWAVFITLAPRQTNLALEMLKVLSALWVLSTLQVWIIFPFLSSSPPGDDASKFLASSGIPPLLSAALFLTLYLAGWALLLTRTEPLRALLARFLQADEGWSAPGIERTAAVMAGLVALAALTAWWANGFSIHAPPMRQAVQPPDGYTLASQIELSAAETHDQTLLEFQLEQGAPAGIYLVVKGINTPYIDVQLYGPDGYSKVLLHGEGYSSTLDTALFDERLAPGSYTLALTSQPSPGLLTVYKRE